MKGLITSNQRRASIWQLAAHWTRFAASLLIGGGSGLGFADWLAPAVLLWGNYYCALYRESGGRRDWWLKMKILTIIRDKRISYIISHQKETIKRYNFIFFCFL